MDEHLCWDLGVVPAGTSYEVELRGSPANVCLLDAEHYQAYLEDDEFVYFGGFHDVSPAVVEVPYDDHWFLLVDGYEQRIKVRYTEFGA